MGDTPRLGFPKLVEGQETPYVTHNEALNRLDGVINIKVL
ncbi:MAG: ribonuclease III, partial [Chloroflexi bacterium CG_4_9_14_3_um_filter_45_9]